MRQSCGVPILCGAILLSLRAVGETPDELATRRGLIEEARKASNARGDARALALADRAAEIRRSAAVRRCMAQEQCAVGRLASAIENAELCAREAAEDKTLKNRKAILRTCKQLLTALQRSAALVIVSLPSPIPPGTRV